MVPEVVTLAPGFVVSRIAKGNWQLAERHGAPYAREAAIDDMRRFVEAGITLFDCADHYVGVEQLIGEFRRRHPDHARRLRVSTKLVPDLESLPRLRRRDVENIVDTSLARLGQERLDLVQFHWWDYKVPGYVEAMHWLDDAESGRQGGAHRHHQLRHGAARGDRRERRVDRDEPAPVFRARSPARERPGRVLRRARHQAALLRDAGGRASSASAGSERPSPGRRSPTARSSSIG